MVTLPFYFLIALTVSRSSFGFSLCELCSDSCLSICEDTSAFLKCCEETQTDKAYLESIENALKGHRFLHKVVSKRSVDNQAKGSNDPDSFTALLRVGRSAETDDDVIRLGKRSAFSNIGGLSWKKRLGDSLRLGKRGMDDSMRLGKRTMVDSMRLGKRQWDPSWLGKRVIDSMRLGKRSMDDSMRLGKRYMDDSMRLGKRSMDDSMRLGKRGMDDSMRLGKRGMDDSMRLGKRSMDDSMRLGKRSMDDSMRLGKRGMDDSMRLGKRSMDDSMRLGKRSMDSMRLGKRELDSLRLGKRTFGPLTSHSDAHNPESKEFVYILNPYEAKYLNSGEY